MNNLNHHIERHYHRDGLYENIVKVLYDQGIDLKKVTRKDIAGVDEFHVRGAEVSREIAQSIDLRGVKLLDVGCGLGGPCRMLADEFDCEVTGIDLSAEYIRTATKLSDLVNLNQKTYFIQADAINLPFEDTLFDVVWTQHVQMNISNKQLLYSGIKKVLKPGGHFIYYDIFKKGSGSIDFPVPWANRSELSFLFTSTDLQVILDTLGFTKIQTKDETKAGITFFENVIAKQKAEGPPKLGLNVLMGESTKIKIRNLLDGLKSEKLELQSAVFKLK